MMDEDVERRHKLLELHFLREKVDPSYARPYYEIMEPDILLALAVPLAIISGVTQVLYNRCIAEVEVPKAIEARFPTDIDEGFWFHVTTRWNTDAKKCLALELMVLEPDRLTHFAAWKASQLEKTERVGSYLDEFNHAYKKKFFPGGMTYRDG